ncbi:MAG: alpha/beta fold hydrolase [Phycisphaerales bacterium JB052]
MARLLIILLLVVSPSVTFAQSDQALLDRYDRMYASGKYEQALRVAELISERYPESATWHFNRGALYAKLGQLDAAILQLQQSADLGFTGIASFEQNADLDSVRDREDFKAVLELVRSAAKARMDAFQVEARRHEPKVYVPPAAATESRALIVALHGTGMDGESMYDALRETAELEGMILVCPDALRPAGAGFSWTYRDESSWFVNHLIDWAIEEHGADPARVILVGFSQGANIALIMGQTQPELFAGVVPICGHYEAQIAEAAQTPAPFYLMTGARDPWKRTYNDARRDFEDAGAAVQVRLLPSVGHALPSGKVGTREYVRAVRWVLEQGVED